ncbi:hypothetical protein COU18_03055 [Candidatus Kaiserbacteria bacterium CG10_big_fil_rev_8_21_14_0_10_51_14]|uniref:Inositol-1-monophosphatase n=1 Tax=Candidatus Kaiserbacteria bacterium CG10_big_fil_rev_8_21_14_0_10_51_14 TaxID=1974610 RepID=A0A2H0UD80_9BACT|nr:MAG: hypothetical protein COU18_03055 [Candidatus Kaiserbacteria bacterium CG10_big_fil_rev_8_21_14_0_10_51_14]
MDKFIQDIAREAGEAVLKRFGKDGMHYMKSQHVWDVVTKADLAADKLITSRIIKRYPTHGIISEESGVRNEGAEYVWIIDPIDGTLNFSKGIPMFGVMICLVHKGKVVMSAINMPATKELFFAKVGTGAFLNGKRIHYSRRSTLDQSFGFGSSRMGERNGAFLGNIIQQQKKHNIQFSSFACMCANACYTAAGRRDWIVSLAGQIWDFAPAYLILKESGCKVTDTKGNPWKFGMLEMVAANPRLHKQLLKLTRNV